jgi:deoxyribonuclease V
MTQTNRWLVFNNAKEACDTQKEMAASVLTKDDFQQPIKHIAGMDASNNRFDPQKMVYAAAITLAYPCLTPLTTVTEANRQTIPYIPGLLGFREAPILYEAYKQLPKPDLIMVDGQGISHPRGLGIASHLGVLLDIPTIGVAKSILIGTPAGPLAEEAGSTVSLIWKEKEIGVLLRTKKRCAPLIISVGHRISLPTAINLVMSCLKGYRLPEPTRLAHLAANARRKSS